MNWDSCAMLFRALSAEAALTLGALFVLAVDMAFLRKRSHSARATAATLGGVGALGAALFALRYFGDKMLSITDSEIATFLTVWKDNGLQFSQEVIAAKSLILLFGILSLGIFRGTSRLKNPAEFVALTLFALAGLSLMCSADNLLMIFVALELASLSLYILAGFDKTRPESAEAGLKYFLFGGTAAAFLLFGFSLLYGLTGELSVSAIGARLPAVAGTPLFFVASLMVLAGFGYKAAVAPFHLWAPDTYEGAPAVSGALIASASKVGGLVLLARFLLGTLHLPLSDTADAPEVLFAVNPALQLGLVVAIAASLLLGNIAALAQQGVRRLLAYSAIAHAGVMLIAARNTALGGGKAIPTDPDGVPDFLLYYLLAYGLANIGAFGVVAILENNGKGGVVKIRDLAGLWRRSPFLGICLLVFILSLAGVPPLAGFLAKFFVFADALRLASPVSASDPFFWLVLLAIAMSAVALYYYLQILKAAFVAAPEIAPESANAAAPAGAPTGKIRVHLAAAAVLAFAALGLLALGIWPGLLAVF